MLVSFFSSDCSLYQSKSQSCFQSLAANIFRLQVTLLIFCSFSSFLLYSKTNSSCWILLFFFSSFLLNFLFWAWLPWWFISHPHPKPWAELRHLQWCHSYSVVESPWQCHSQGPRVNPWSGFRRSWQPLWHALAKEVFLRVFFRKKGPANLGPCLPSLQNHEIKWPFISRVPGKRSEHSHRYHQ